MSRSKSGQKIRRTQIRQQQKRARKRQKLSEKLGVTIDELFVMMERGQVQKIL